MINEDMIYDKINETNDINEKKLLLKLYFDYNKCYEKKDRKINLIDIKASYENIKYNLYKCNKIDLIDYANNYISLLRVYINHFDSSNKECLISILKLITYLEATLNMNITFPEVIEMCINDKMKIKENKEEKEKTR